MFEHLRESPDADREIPTELVVVLDYTNHRGERALRRVVPKRVWFGSTAWHPADEWLLEALDLDRQAQRDFALSGIHSMQAWAGGRVSDVSDRRRDRVAAERVRVR